MYQYSPRIDFAFKKLFGSEENTDILLAFINSILDTRHQIVSVEILNPYRAGNMPIDKSVILDVRAKDEKGRQYHIEMQVNGEVAYDQRALYYWSKLYSKQLQKGQTYNNLKKTISIHILNFDFFHQEDGYHHIFRLMHVDSKNSYFEDIELHFLELERFRKTNHKLLSALDRWTAFLSKAEEYDSKKLPTDLTQDPIIVRAFQALGALSLDDTEQEVYEAREKWLMDETEILQNVAKKSHQKGREEGRQEGREEGESVVRRAVAMRLKVDGHTDEAIGQILGVDLTTLKALLEKDIAGAE